MVLNEESSLCQLAYYKACSQNRFFYYFVPFFSHNLSFFVVHAAFLLSIHLSDSLFGRWFIYKI